MKRFLLSPGLALVAALCSVLGLAPAPALAANILVVSDSTTDTNIASVLRADGHTVTLVSNDYGTGNAALRGELSAYDSVFWSATTTGYGYGNHSDPALFTHLTDYVAGGGRMFVTGYQSLGTPDPLLIAFVGGTSVNSYPGGPGAVSGIESSLTVGPAGDLRGVTPMQYSYDLDAVVGLMADTIEIAGSMPGYGGGPGGSQWTLRTVGSGEIAYVSNGDYSTAEPYSWTVPTPGAAGAYNAAIRNFAAASEGASGEPGAPLVRFDAPFGAFEGDEVVIAVEVTDEEGDEITYSWDLDGDGEFGENTGMPSHTIAAGTLDGPTSLRISVQASDGEHTTVRTRTLRVQNVVPRITSEPLMRVSVEQQVRHEIVVEEPGGASDPLTWTLLEGPSSAVLADGAFHWQPAEADITRAGRTHSVLIQIADDDGGVATQEWQLEVSPNRAPTNPIQLHPIGGIGIREDMPPRLIVQNGVDGDGDALTYFFQIDRVDTFDSPDLRESGEVAQTAGFTAWQLTEELGLGPWYWRAWLTDGEAMTQPVTASFVVVPDPSRIPDAGMGDGGGPDGGTVMRPDGERGCSCRAPGSGPSSPGAGALVMFAVVAMVLGRRRR